MTLHAAQEDTRDPKPLWWWMRLFVILGSLVYFAAAASTGVTWAIYRDLMHLPAARAKIVDLVTVWASMGSVVVIIVGAFATLRLAYRLTKNLEVTGNDANLPSPGWVCGSFFTPIANLFVPPMLISRVWRATFASKPDPMDGSLIITWWWAAWIISGIMLTYSGFLQRSLDAHAALTTSAMTARATYWGTLSLAYTIRGICCYLLLAVFGALVRGQVRPFDASDFD